MVVLLRTNDIVLISVVESLLDEAGIGCFVADQHISALEGGIGAFPRRIMVPADREAQARRLLTDAGLAHELAPRP
ncbi:putative signal transducing protein [Alsobacter sp. R-9]